jgi:hypothetical protein
MSSRHLPLASLLTLLIAGGACSPAAGSSAPGSGGASAAGSGTGDAPFISIGSGGGASVATPGGGCTAGTRSCYCPDGTASGTQICDAQGRLTVCDCPPKALTVQPSSSDTPAQLCAELQGKATCSAKTYASEQVPSSILFVVDRSGSMDCNAPPVQTVESCNQVAKRQDPSQPSRWETTVNALNGSFAGLSGSTASVGLSLFSNDGNCGVDPTPVVELAPSSAVQSNALSEALAAAKPAGGTPIVGSVVLAYKHLHEQLHATGNRYVVLITDGEEGCGTKGDEADKADLEAARNILLNTEVKKAKDANIRTFVIGAPGSEGARGFLSELAFQGGTARTPSCVHGGTTDGDCHFDLTQGDFAQVLKDTLGKIGGKALGCEFQAPAEGHGLVNVQVSQKGGVPACLPQLTGACDGSASGWQFAKNSAGAVDENRVVLCGAACDQAIADPTTVVDVILGCGSIIR